jgi:iron complex transport system substrate-binding protein
MMVIYFTFFLTRLKACSNMRDRFNPMLRRITLLAVIVLSFAASYAGKRIYAESYPRGPGSAPVARKAEVPQRIVSLAPSVTETLFALGLGDRVVGVTRFCSYPPEARSRAKVGGYFDPSYEAMAALRPDLVIMLSEQEETIKFLDALGIPNMTVNHRNVAGIMNSITAIGAAAGAEARARELNAELRAKVERIKGQTAGRARPRVLVSVGRDLGTGGLKEVFISGGDGFYNDLIAMAGGVNVYAGKTISYPTVSAETILRLDPEVIIEIAPRLQETGLEPAAVIREWETVPQVAAVRDHRVYVFGQDYTGLPGPRFTRALEDFARVIHPEVELSQ